MNSKKSAKKSTKKRAAKKPVKKKTAKKISKKKVAKKATKKASKKEAKTPKSASALTEWVPKVGRPPDYKTTEDLVKVIDEYFEKVEVEKLTLTGLAIALGFESRQSIYDYEKKPEFTYTIRRARLFVENTYEILLKSGKIPAIFALKNFGWRDKLEVDQNNTNSFEPDPRLKNLPPEIIKEMRESQEAILAKVSKKD